MFALVDCNSCYASCEQIFRPDLRGQALVVLSNNDGCIVAASKEAKALGIPAFEPFYKIKHLVKQHNIHVFSSNYALYGDISQRIMQLLESYSHAIEVYSIDEAFLNLTGFQQLYEHGQVIRRACWKQQRMPVSIGIAHTKTLAKLANHIAKKSQRLNGVCVIEDSQQWLNVFKKIPAYKIWGVGKRLAKKLALHNIHNVYDFYQAPPKQLRKAFNVQLEKTWQELHGISCISFEEVPASKQSIGVSRSFQTKITSQQELRERLAQFASRAAEKLRQQQQLTAYVQVAIQSSRFKENHYKKCLGSPLLTPTNNSCVIAKTCNELLNQAYKDKVAYARAGVQLFELSHEQHQQFDMLNQTKKHENTVLMQTLDNINKRYGSNKVYLASLGKSPQALTTRDYQSPYYTTRLDDLPIVKLS